MLGDLRAKTVTYDAGDGVAVWPVDVDRGAAVGGVVPEVVGERYGVLARADGLRETKRQLQMRRPHLGDV